MPDLDLQEISSGGVLNEALKDCASDRQRWQVIFWILNHLKYMNRPDFKGWGRTAARMREMSADGIEAEAAKFFHPSFNRSCIKGWQQLVCAAVALKAGIEYSKEHCKKGLERLLDNAHAEKNKGAIEKWEYVEKTLMHDQLRAILESLLAFMSHAINGGTSQPGVMRCLNDLPYGPQAETATQKQQREEAVSKSDADFDDF